MLVFECPRCHHSYSVSDRKAGHKIACYTCGQRLMVPSPPVAETDSVAGRRLIPIVLAGVVGLCILLLAAGVGLFILANWSGPAPGTAFADNQPPPATQNAANDQKSPVASITLAQSAHAVLQTACYRCHGENGVAEGGLNFILDPEKLVARRKIVPGNPGKSRLFRRVEQEEMPPEGEQPRPSKADIALLSRWIQAGAPAPPASEKPLPYTTTADFVEQIHASMLALPDRDRRFARFFTLTHLANAGLRQDELQTYRLSLSKLLNSLSWRNEIVNPRAVDSAQTILRIDIRDYQWNEQIWKGILAKYSYGISWDHPRTKECFELAGNQLPFIRADWFLAEGAQPPLYNDILQLPTTERELEKQLHIEVAANIRQERVARAGFNGSGVSRNNRLIERHASPYGSYWRSYDFADNVGKRNLFAFPLGPSRDAKSFFADGGEVIFNLPNGLHAFMLVDQNGSRLDKAPQKIVSDPKRPDRAVVNGISCMSCHTRGLIAKKDQVRPHVENSLGSFSAHEIDTVRALYLPEGQMNLLFAKDNDQFRSAVEKTGVKLTSTEPINSLAARFEQELDLPTAAAELGLRPAELSEKLEQSPALSRTLGPLRVPGGTVQRQVFTDAIPEMVKALKL
jgi:mono/diheme cytochrome c family protein